VVPRGALLVPFRTVEGRRQLSEPIRGWATSNRWRLPAKLDRLRQMLMVVLLILTPACSDEGTSQPGVGNRLVELNLTRKVPWQVRQACDDAERFATVRVICPRLVPDVRITTMKGSFGTAVGSENPHVYMITFDKDFFGSTPPPEGVKHWVVGGGEADSVQKWVLSDQFHEVEGDARLVRTVTRGQHRILIYRFPDYPAGGINGSHVAALVHIGDEVVFTSLHGERYARVAIEMVVDLAEQAVRKDSVDA
jgi:hypothetical protein